jgi:Arc/MetJ family transcription regulator
MTRTRTNIELEDEPITVIMRRFGISTKVDAVNMAIRRLAGSPMTKEEALGMRGAGAIEEIPQDTGPR